MEELDLKQLEQIPVPEGLEERLSESIDVWARAEKRRSARRWVAAAAVAALVAGVWWVVGIQPDSAPLPLTPTVPTQIAEAEKPQPVEAVQQAEEPLPAPEVSQPKPVLRKPSARKTTTEPSHEALERARRLLEEQRLLAMMEEALESEEVQKIIEEYSRDMIYTVSL